MSIVLNRRDFVAGAAALGVVGATTGCAHRPARTRYEEEAARLPVVDAWRPRWTSAWIPKGDLDPSFSSLRSVVDAATDFSWLKAGDRVLLKISINSGKPYPSTTDPWLVAGMIALLRERGAGRILVGDQSGVEWVMPTEVGTRGSSRDCCASAGILPVILSSGAEAVFFEESGYDAYFDAVPDGAHHWPEPLRVARVVQEVDHIVYLPRVASHAIGTITSGLKIGVGFLRQDSRRTFHLGGQDLPLMYEEIHQIPDIARRLRLVVSSGTRILTSIGPDIGHVAQPDPGVVFASTDLVAHELMAFAWLRHGQEDLTPCLARFAGTLVAGNRSMIHRSWARRMWKPLDSRVPDVPMFQGGEIQAHPALVNAMRRKGGRPAGLRWEQVGPIHDEALTGRIRQILPEWVGIG